jgi:hypothetical protein
MQSSITWRHVTTNTTDNCMKVNRLKCYAAMTTKQFSQPAANITSTYNYVLNSISTVDPPFVQTLVRRQSFMDLLADESSVCK